MRAINGHQLCARKPCMHFVLGKVVGLPWPLQASVSLGPEHRGSVQAMRYLVSKGHGCRKGLEPVCGCWLPLQNMGHLAAGLPAAAQLTAIQALESIQAGRVWSAAEQAGGHDCLPGEPGCEGCHREGCVLQAAAAVPACPAPARGPAQAAAHDRWCSRIWRRPCCCSQLAPTNW